MGSKLAIAAGVVLVGGLAVCGGGGYLAYRWVDDAGVPAATFDAIVVGAPQAQTLQSLPESVELPAEDVYAAGDTDRSAMPAGADCRHYLPQDLPPGDGAQVYRVCFAAGKVVEKKTVVAAGTA
jgi:hypothetical protein